MGRHILYVTGSKVKETANRRISNIEPQNIEGWNRCVLAPE
jgi:hypothetical protein